MEDILKIAKNAKKAYLTSMNLDNSVKNAILDKIKEKLEQNKEEILSKNQEDLKSAKTLLNSGEINSSTYDRLKLNEPKLRDLIKGLEDLKGLNDPVNQVLWQKELDKDLILKKVSTPIGTIGVIFEARPDCFIQISSLIIKSGNCGILKGGKECEKTNTIFNKIVKSALNEVNPKLNDVINLIYSRDDVKNMLELDKYIDLIIPRGGNSLVAYIKENTKIPVLGHASGICHIFVDKDYDLAETIKIITDAKTQYPSACNAVETVLIHKDFKDINLLKEKLVENGIEIIENPENYSTEYGKKTLSLKVVDNIDEAIEHINQYGSGHTESILSNDEKNVEKFMNFVDSSSVFSNCSTRFSDGFRYGFGAEVGISTNKTHARGPVGLEGLTIYKYKLYGKNAIVAPYSNGEKEFHHKFIN